ncbi:MAG: flagellin N-terminal helical domain-containing protein [Planctomycetota bacterium]|jgi:flagellin
MSRINTNVSSMLAQRILGQQNKGLGQTLERLSTGLRINRGKDDPAGLIASENLRAEKTALSSAIANAERADQVINIAEGGLTEISNLLNELEGLVTQSANESGLSNEEKEANQLQVDSILQTIDRIANSTSFQGVKLLNGTFDYTLSGQNTTELSEVTVDAAKLPDGGAMSVTVDLVTSAQTGALFLSAGTGNTLSGTSLTLEIAGNDGIQQFTIASGTSAASIVSSVNAFKDVTGVSASTTGAYIQFDSTAFGDAEFVSVKKIAGDAAYDTAINNTAAAGGAAEKKDFGRDAVVTINGSTANVTGTKARVASSSLDVTVDIAAAFNVDGNQSTFQITGGGAEFQLAPRVDLAGKGVLGIAAVTTGQLGSVDTAFLSTLATGGANNLVDGNTGTAQRSVESAITQVSKLRGRLGSFQSTTIGASIRALGVALENTAAAESQIRDTDFAAETANLTRSQILVQASTNILSISNASPQNVLALLG